MEKLLAFFTTLSLIFSYLFGLSGVTTSENYEYVGTDKISSVVSIFSAQGICCDGDYFYCSGAISALNITGLVKFDTDMHCKKINESAVPKEFTEKYGSDHIGGIDCANGYIYASVEGKIDGEYKYDFILLYDCETLDYTGIYYDLSSEHLTDGIPWCAVDADKGVLYTSQYNNVYEILCYDLETMELINTIQLSEKLDRIQGGSVYEDMLYLSYDVSGSTTEQILKVNPDSGEVSPEMTRTLPNYDNEAEDICYYPLSDGTVLHTLDYDKLINANVRHYKITV